MRHTHLHRISDQAPQKAFSGWYLVFLVFALIGIVLFIYWNLAHPRHVL